MYEGEERRTSGGRCMDHSGLMARLKTIEDASKANCKKLDSLKMWIIASLGTVVASLVMQILSKVN